MAPCTKKSKVGNKKVANAQASKDCSMQASEKGKIAVLELSVMQERLMNLKFNGAATKPGPKSLEHLSQPVD